MYAKKIKYPRVSFSVFLVEKSTAHGKISGLPKPGVFVPNVILGKKIRTPRILRRKPNAGEFYRTIVQWDAMN